MEEQLVAIINWSVENSLYSNAIFYAERYFERYPTQHSLYVLGNVYYKSGKVSRTYHLFKSKIIDFQSDNEPTINQGSQNPNSFSHATTTIRYLFALCAHNLGKYKEAELALLSNVSNSGISSSVNETSSLNELNNHAIYFHLLGVIYMKMHQRKKAVEYLKKSLEKNPFMWSSFELLCRLGEEVDSDSIFEEKNSFLHRLEESESVQRNSQVPHLLFSPSITPSVTPAVTPNTPAVSLTPNDHIFIRPSSKFTKEINNTPVFSSNYSENIPSNVIANNITSRSDFKAPIHFQDEDLNLSIEHDHHDDSIDLMDVSISKSFDVDVSLLSTNGATNSHAPTPLTQASHNPRVSRVPDVPLSKRKKPDPKRKVLFQTPESTERDQIAKPISHPPPSTLKASSSLPHAPKKNTKPITRSKNTVTATPASSSNNNNNNNSATSSISKEKQEIKEKAIITSSSHELMKLLKQIARGYKLLFTFKCREAISAFSQLPSCHLEGAWISSLIGRAYYEIVEYEESKKYFEASRKKEPYRTEAMEIYSTLLWHMKKEKDLSHLAIELTEYDKLSPESWCAVANSFSLQSDHSTAIKFFQRALQLDPHFTYIHTLCGHEYLSGDELDKALACFRNALKNDEKHYNAWVAIALVYYRQEKYELAEFHFRRAIQINPFNSVLYCYLGMVLQALYKSGSSVTKPREDNLHQAIKMLDISIKLNPTNTVAKFTRARVLRSMKKFKEALILLEDLKEVTPKEPAIYFLIGKIHKKLGNTDQALNYFRTALDFDSKNSPSINAQIDSLQRDNTEEAEIE